MKFYKNISIETKRKGVTEILTFPCGNYSSTVLCCVDRNLKPHFFYKAKQGTFKATEIPESMSIQIIDKLIKEKEQTRIVLFIKANRILFEGNLSLLGQLEKQNNFEAITKLVDDLYFHVVNNVLICTELFTRDDVMNIIRKTVGIIQIGYTIKSTRMVNYPKLEPKLLASMHERRVEEIERELKYHQGNTFESIEAKTKLEHRRNLCLMFAKNL